MMKHNNYYLCFLILHGLFPQNFGWIFKYYYSIPGIWNAFISLPVLEIWLLTKFSFQSIKTKYWLISKIIWRTQNNTYFPNMYTLHFRTRHPKKKNNSNFSFNICFIKQGWNIYDGKIIMHCFKNIVIIHVKQMSTFISKFFTTFIPWFTIKINIHQL